MDFIVQQEEKEGDWIEIEAPEEPKKVDEYLEIDYYEPRIQCEVYGDETMPKEKIPTTQFEKELRRLPSIKVSKKNKVTKSIYGENYINVTDALKLFRKHLKQNKGMF